MWRTRRLHDPTEILTYLETDRLYAAYAIGDLDPVMSQACTWAGAERSGRLQAVALHFRALKLPALFLMGDSSGVQAILRSELRPTRVYLTCLRQHLTASQRYYCWEEVIPMWRMVLGTGHSQTVDQDCVRLSQAQLEQLAALYALGGGDAFGPSQLVRGVFYGIVADGRIVAVAGTHLVSAAYGVAAIGNVFTHPNYRGRGYAKAATSHVVSELLSMGIRDIILNVSQENHVATHLYERLGFEPYCPFLEGPARAKEALCRNLRENGNMA